MLHFVVDLVVDAWQVECQSVRVVAAHRSMSHTTATMSMNPLSNLMFQVSSRQAVGKTDATCKAVKISLTLGDERMDQDRRPTSLSSKHFVLLKPFFTVQQEREPTVTLCDRRACWR